MSDHHGSNDTSELWLINLMDLSGGHMDNMAIVPLLIRNVGAIIAFVNASKPFDPDAQYELPEDLRSYFGVGGDVAAKFPFNNVLENGPVKYQKLVVTFSEGGVPNALFPKFRYRNISIPSNPIPKVVHATEDGTEITVDESPCNRSALAV